MILYLYIRRVHQFTFRTLSGRVRFIFRTFPADGRHVLLLQCIYIAEPLVYHYGLYTRRRSRCCRGWWWWAEAGTGKSFLVRRWCKRTICIHNICICTEENDFGPLSLLASPATNKPPSTPHRHLHVQPLVVLYIHIWRRKEE